MVVVFLNSNFSPFKNLYKWRSRVDCSSNSGSTCFTINPDTFPMFQGIVPDKTGWCINQRIFLNMRITSEPCPHIFFNIIGNNCHISPLMPFSRAFSRYIKIVQSNEILYRVYGYLGLFFSRKSQSEVSPSPSVISPKI